MTNLGSDQEPRYDVIWCKEHQGQSTHGDEGYYINSWLQIEGPMKRDSDKVVKSIDSTYYVEIFAKVHRDSDRDTSDFQW